MRDWEDRGPGEQERPWLVVDAMNVIGSRPTGWWHDRMGAVRDFVERLHRYATETGTWITAVIDGEEFSQVPEGVHGRVEVLYAGGGPNAADDRIVELLAESPREATVVTADQELQDRAAEHDAWLVTPLELLGRLTELEEGSDPNNPTH